MKKKIKITRLDPEKMDYIKKKLAYEGLSFQSYSMLKLFPEGWRNEHKKLCKTK